MSAQVEAALLGLAVADALGAPFEFSTPERARAGADAGLEMTGGGGWEAGEWTDDTAMALRLAECLADRGVPLDFDDLARRYSEWAGGGPKDIGNITRVALSGVSSAAEARANAEAGHEATGQTAGNGTIMRVTPLAFAPLEDEEVVAVAREEARLTHWDGEAGDASAALCAALRAVGAGGDPIDAARDVAAHPRCQAAIEVAASDDQAGAAALASAGGTCWSTLAVALLAFKAPDYEEGVSWAISLGYDADTNAAVAGALLACRDGLAAIPARWLDGLKEQDRIRAAATGIASLHP